MWLIAAKEITSGLLVHSILFTSECSIIVVILLFIFRFYDEQTAGLGQGKTNETKN